MLAVLPTTVYQYNIDYNSSNYHRHLSTLLLPQRTPVETMFLIIGCYQEHFLCAALGTMSSRFCVPDTVCDVPDIIWNIVPNIIRHIFLIPDLCS